MGRRASTFRLPGHPAPIGDAQHVLAQPRRGQPHNGFALHGSADSPSSGTIRPRQTPTKTNAAFGNGNIGFYLTADTGPTVGNTLRRNVACHNATSDAVDENTLGSNVWTDNRFCTSVMPQPQPPSDKTIDFTTSGGGVFDPLFYQSDGLVFPPQRCGPVGCDSWFVGFIQGDEALVLTPALGSITGTFTNPISALSMQIAPVSQGTATYTLTAFNGGQIVASRSVTVTQDSGDPQSGPFGYFTLDLGQLPAPATSFQLDDVFVRSSFGINQIECGVSSITFASS